MATELSIVEFLKLIEACPEAIIWAGEFRELEELWRACPHAEWMIWSLEQLGYQDEAGLRLFATACARHHWHLLADPRSRQAVEVAESFAWRRTSMGQLRHARAAAQAAADEATGRKHWTAAAATAAMTACHTTRISGLTAAREASKYGLRAAAWDPGTHVTPDDEDAWQSDQLRRIIGPNLPQIIELAHRKIDAAAH